MSQSHDSRSKNKSKEIERALAFSFGVVFILVLLIIAYITPTPSDFQIFIYRITMALAAGGIGAIIPGFLVVQVHPVVKAGGAIACFTLVYLVNPPSLASHQIRTQAYSELMERGEAALSDGNTTVAEYLFTRASTLAPDDYLPLLKLGNAAFDGGRFATALDYYEKALAKSNPADPTIRFGIALSQEALDELAQSLDTYKKMDSELAGTPLLDNDVKFSMGQIKLKMWQKDLSNSALSRDSENDFKVFLERKGEPTHWAHYHLACLYVTRIATGSATTDIAASLRDRAISEIRTTVEELKKSKSKKRDIHRTMLIQLITSTHLENWLPGNPVVCPPLQSLTIEIFPEIEKVL